MLSGKLLGPENPTSTVGLFLDKQTTTATELVACRVKSRKKSYINIPYTTDV